jgi:hypothetical protein
MVAKKPQWRRGQRRPRLAAFRGVPRIQRRQACGPAGIPEPGLAASVWRRVRPERRVGRDSETPRLAMKWRAPDCIEVEQDQEARWAARR